MCLLDSKGKKKKAALLARFAFPLQKRAWEERVRCPKKSLVQGYLCHYLWLVELLSEQASPWAWSLLLREENASAAGYAKNFHAGVWNSGSAQRDLHWVVKLCSCNFFFFGGLWLRVYSGVWVGKVVLLARWVAALFSALWAWYRRISPSVTKMVGFSSFPNEDWTEQGRQARWQALYLYSQLQRKSAVFTSCALNWLFLLPSSSWAREVAESSGGLVVVGSGWWSNSLSSQMPISLWSLSFKESSAFVRCCIPKRPNLKGLCDAFFMLVGKRHLFVGGKSLIWSVLLK